MKILLEYDESTGIITDNNGMTFHFMGLVSFPIVESKSVVLDLIKQGLTADDLVKLKNQDLL